MNKIISTLKKHPTLSWILGFQFFRLVLLPFMGLMPQDAYYYLYGQNLSLSYFDHPGMIGYLLRLFSEVLGQSVFVVKFTDFFITSLTIYSFHKLVLIFLPKRKAQNAMLLLVSTIFISILSFNSTPDVPLMLFWTLSILCLYRAIFQHKKWYWILAGITMGLAFVSKYTGILLQFGLIAFLLFSNNYRKLYLSPWLWISLVISIGVTFPVWWWNYQNEFASFTFQSSARTGEISKFKFHPNFLLGAVTHQLLLLLPTLFFAFIVMAFKHIKKVVTKFKLPSEKTRFLLAFFLPTFIGFMLITPIYWVKLNWFMPSYISGIIIVAMYLSKKIIKIHLIIAILLHVVLATEILFYLVPVKSDDTWVGWKELSQEVMQLQRQYNHPFIFSADGYKTSAVLNFYMSERVYAQNIIGLPALHFDYLNDHLQKLKGKNALYIDSDKRFKNSDKREEVLPTNLNHYFEKIEELDPIILKVGQKNVRKFWVFYCTNYQPKNP